MGVDPEEGEGAVWVKGQGQVLAIQGPVRIRRPNFVVKIQVLVLKSSPVLLGRRCRVWKH